MDPFEILSQGQNQTNLLFESINNSIIRNEAGNAQLNAQKWEGALAIAKFKQDEKFTQARLNLEASRIKLQEKQLDFGIKFDAINTALKIHELNNRTRSLKLGSAVDFQQSKAKAVLAATESFDKIYGPQIDEAESAWLNAILIDDRESANKYKSELDDIKKKKREALNSEIELINNLSLDPEKNRETATLFNDLDPNEIIEDADLITSGAISFSDSDLKRYGLDSPIRSPELPSSQDGPDPSLFPNNGARGSEGDAGTPGVTGTKALENNITGNNNLLSGPEADALQSIIFRRVKNQSITPEQYNSYSRQIKARDPRLDKTRNNYLRSLEIHGNLKLDDGRSVLDEYLDNGGEFESAMEALSKNQADKAIRDEQKFKMERNDELNNLIASQQTAINNTVERINNYNLEPESNTAFNIELQKEALNVQQDQLRQLLSEQKSLWGITDVSEPPVERVTQESDIDKKLENDEIDKSNAVDRIIERNRTLNVSGPSVKLSTRLNNLTKSPYSLSASQALASQENINNYIKENDLQYSSGEKIVTPNGGLNIKEFGINVSRDILDRPINNELKVNLNTPAAKTYLGDSYLNLDEYQKSGDVIAFYDVIGRVDKYLDGDGRPVNLLGSMILKAEDDWDKLKKSGNYSQFTESTGIKESLVAVAFGDPENDLKRRFIKSRVGGMIYDMQSSIVNGANPISLSEQNTTKAIIGNN